MRSVRGRLRRVSARPLTGTRDVRPRSRGLPAPVRAGHAGVYWNRETVDRSAGWLPGVTLMEVTAMRPGKIVLLVLGAITALVALGLVIAGGALTWIHTAERDDAGYYTTPTERFETPTYALRSGHVDLGADV